MGAPEEADGRPPGRPIKTPASSQVSRSAARAERASLSPKVPVEKPTPARACSDADNIGSRMLELHVSAGATYQSTAAAVVEERLEQAGVRLAMMLNEAAKPAPAEK